MSRAGGTENHSVNTTSNTIMFGFVLLRDSMYVWANNQCKHCLQSELAHKTCPEKFPSGNSDVTGKLENVFTAALSCLE